LQVFYNIFEYHLNSTKRKHENKNVIDFNNSNSSWIIDNLHSCFLYKLIRFLKNKKKERILIGSNVDVCRNVEYLINKCQNNLNFKKTNLFVHFFE